MKLASLKHGRDGKLIVVFDDLAWYADAGHIAPTLQTALDDWARTEPALRNPATAIRHGATPHGRFQDPAAAAQIGRESSTERGCQTGDIEGCAGYQKQKQL